MRERESRGTGAEKQTGDEGDEPELDDLGGGGKYRRMNKTKRINKTKRKKKNKTKRRKKTKRKKKTKRRRN